MVMEMGAEEVMEEEVETVVEVEMAEVVELEVLVELVVLEERDRLVLMVIVLGMDLEDVMGMEGVEVMAEEMEMEMVVEMVMEEEELEGLEELVE